MICERFRSNQVVNNKVSKLGNCDDFGFGMLHLKTVKKSIVIHFLQKRVFCDLVVLSCNTLHCSFYLF